VKRTTLITTLALLLAACGSGDATSDGTDPTASGMTGMDDDASVSPASERPSTDATLRIVSPTDGEVVEGDVELEVELDGAKLVAETSTDLRPDEGHLHVLLDDQLISMTEGLEQTITDVAPGDHLLKVEFVANDHAPFDPRVIAAVAFEAES
jgi:hypothetical protein